MIISTSSISVDENFMASDVDIMVFEPCFLSRGGVAENKEHGPDFLQPQMNDSHFSVVTFQVVEIFKSDGGVDLNRCVLNCRKHASSIAERALKHENE